MIEYDESEMLQSAVSDSVLTAVRGFFYDQPQIADKLLYRWQDMNTYSDELQDVINIITGGNPPGQPKENSHEKIS
jgi:hypothetical protein